ncbi:hypothetical protein Pint_05426 [Pistacia integerrima]|uniref:Uncharacterized protein n=1 Tax=Pistacia integerrima TaxID=434235 RepID=A0ACC0Z367_9ROSI|nr:hypothetical protein Pint_05426 [Pistacia integerrima]
MDSSASCPFCHLTFPLTQLQRHANSHFDDEDDNKPNPNLSSKISFLIGSQIKSNFHKINDSLVFLLRKCLEQEHDSSTTTYLSSYVDHFQSVVSEDVGWGCGWRNIQMLSSFVISERQDAKDVLFGGSGFVPDIPSLQRWLEIAWERGFDMVGSGHFNQSIYGSRSWIGATECAALFRSFGLFARVVDFSDKELENLYLSVPNTVKRNDVKGKRKAWQVLGPMDRYLVRKNCDGNVGGEICRNSVDGGSGNNVENTESERHQILMDWVWNYFSDETSMIYGHPRVIISKKSPLYFQHDGHSRTIVGIQVKNQKKGIQQYSLLILDPAHKTAALERSLKDNKGWKKLLKRGVHTLKKPQYQLCYIDPGIATGKEMEQLKTIDSTLVTF